ncbi:MAG: type IV toxin-antitoxin system AbiEi family antitoxin domain-containing protein [Bdellovibrionota bacterium]
MNQSNSSKINRLLAQWPHGAVFTSKWLTSNGYPPDLVGLYHKRNWLTPVGRGAWMRKSDKISWKGGLYAIQKQLSLDIHPGASTALNFYGLAHYVPLAKDQVYIFGAPGSKLPKWFKNYDWGVSINYKTSNAFSKENSLGLQDRDENSFSIKISSPERAILELLFLVPKDLSFEFAEQHMESLMTLRPKLVQSLLETCTSVKVKRLFLYLAEHLEMNWVEKIDIRKIDLGFGKRVIAKNGQLNNKYKITVPKE